MGEVSVKLNGRSYRLLCEDGNEDRLRELGDHLSGHIDRLTDEFGQIGDDRLLVMASILVTDELWEAREQLAAQRPVAGRDTEDKTAAASLADEHPVQPDDTEPGDAHRAPETPGGSEPSPDHGSPAAAIRDAQNSRTGT